MQRPILKRPGILTNKELLERLKEAGDNFRIKSIEVESLKHQDNQRCRTIQDLKNENAKLKAERDRIQQFIGEIVMTVLRPHTYAMNTIRHMQEEIRKIREKYNL
jgi:FtsZ-binding cell division protein ZapB